MEQFSTRVHLKIKDGDGRVCYSVSNDTLRAAPVEHIAGIIIYELIAALKKNMR